jgi:hypothetical protein
MAYRTTRQAGRDHHAAHAEAVAALREVSAIREGGRPGGDSGDRLRSSEPYTMVFGGALEAERRPIMKGDRR